MKLRNIRNSDCTHAHTHTNVRTHTHYCYPEIGCTAEWNHG